MIRESLSSCSLNVHSNIFEICGIHRSSRRKRHAFKTDPYLQMPVYFRPNTKPPEVTDQCVPSTAGW